jgi:hypothetical protein
VLWGFSYLDRVLVEPFDADLATKVYRAELRALEAGGAERNLYAACVSGALAKSMGMTGDRTHYDPCYVPTEDITAEIEAEAQKLYQRVAQG